MEEEEINDDDLLMDFESGIDTWVIDKDDTNSSVINVDKSLGIEMVDSVIMDKENVSFVENKALHFVKLSNLTNEDHSPQINDNVKRETKVKTDIGHSYKKQKLGFGPLNTTLNDKDLFIQNPTHLSSKTSYASKNKIKDSLSSEEISSLLSEDSTLEDNRERLHAIENVSDLVDTIKGDEHVPLKVGEDHNVSVTTSISNGNKIDYLDMYKNHLLIRNSCKSKNVVENNPKKRHIRKVRNGHARNETLKCNLCIYYTSDRLVFESHKLMYHSTTTDLYCEDCNYHTSQVANLVTHIRTHYDYVDCPYCTFKGWIKQGMEGHLEKAHPETMHFYKCKSCDYSCKTEKKYKKHIQLHFKFQCADCNHYFTSKQILEKHIMTTHYESIKAQSKCGECDLTFPNNFDLKCHNKKVHMKIHKSVDKKKSIKCEKCDSHFARQNYLTLHLRFNHLSECYKCDHCSFQCNDYTAFSKHVCILKMCNVEEDNLRNAEEDNSHAESGEHLTLVDEPITNDIKTSRNTSLRCRYKRKTYKLSRQKVLSLRHNLPSRRNQPQSIPDNQHISTNTDEFKGTQKRKFKMQFNKQKVLVNRNNGTYKASSNQNSVHVMGSKIQKVSRGRPRKIKPLKQLNVPFSCAKLLLGENPPTKVDFVKMDRLRSDNYIECFYQSHDPTYLHSHIESHVRPKTLLSCRFCRYKTNSEQLLQRHIAKYHTWDPALVNILFS